MPSRGIQLWKKTITADHSSTLSLPTCQAFLPPLALHSGSGHWGSIRRPRFMLSYTCTHKSCNSVSKFHL